MCIRRHFAAAVLAASLVTSPAFGATLHDTTGADVDLIPEFGTFQPAIGLQVADGFVVSGGDFQLESITVQLRRISGDGGFVVRFWDDDGGLPGTVLESFAVDGDLPGATDVTLDSVAMPTLSNGGTYWVSAAMSDEVSSGAWSLVKTPPILAAITFDPGVSPDWVVKTRERARFLRVTGIAIPEPTTWALTLCAAIGLAAMRRRRRV